MGHTEPWDAYKLRLGSEWLKYLKDAHNEAQEAFGAEVQAFEISHQKECEEMKRDGVPANMLGEEFHLTKFQEAFPKDVFSFEEWDKLRPDKWVDPNALVPDARAEVDLLKQSERRLEAERKESLI